MTYSSSAQAGSRDRERERERKRSLWLYVERVTQYQPGRDALPLL